MVASPGTANYVYSGADEVPTSADGQLVVCRKYSIPVLRTDGRGEPLGTVCANSAAVLYT